MPPVVPTKELVAERIRELLQRVADGNQAELARRCSLDRMDVYRYLRAENMPGAEHLARIAQSCNVSVDWLLGVNDKSASQPDRKIEIPAHAVAAVDFEAVRRFLGGEEPGDRDIVALRFDEHVRLVDAQEYATLCEQLDHAAKRSRKPRRKPPSR